ncbi:MAG: YoaK family protein [Moraxellaceae bacterium]|nr:YoaK family protein [Moraxellaceae bacterium]
MVRITQYLRTLGMAERTARANRHLGRNLAFVAGAANAGGFLAVHEYTSHMTGVVSAMADHLALGFFALAASGVLALLAFVLGAVVSAFLVNWGRARHLQSEYALPLLLEALVLLLFGLMGARLQLQIDVYVPLTVWLLCFMMGLQNAIITKISRAEIRTTHVTGLVTDIGIGLGRLLHAWLEPAAHPVEERRAARERLALHSSLVLLFFVGGIIGALGFKHIGFLAAVPLACILMLLSVLPVLDDLRARWR